MPTAAVSVATTATLVLAKRTTEPGRIGVIIHNNSAVTVFLGDDNTVTAANGIPLFAGKKMILAPEMPVTQYFYKGDIYGIVAAATADVRVWEMRFV